MNRNFFIIVAILAISIATIFAITFFVTSEQPDSQKPLIQSVDNAPKKVNENPSNEKDLIKAPKNHEHNAHDERALKKEEQEEPKMPEELEKPDEAKIAEMTKKQVSFLYGDLFKDMPLSDTKQEKLVNQLSHSIKAEGELGAKLMDLNIPIEDVLREQEKMTQAQSEELQKFLSPQELDSVKNYQQNLPKKMQKKNLMGIVEKMGLNDSEKSHAQQIIEGAIDRMDGQKTIGQLSKQDILEMREKFAGKKPGDPAHMRAMLDKSEAEMNKLLKNLEELPKYEIFKEQMQMPFRVMRQQLGN